MAATLPALAFGDDEARDVGCAIAVDDEAGDVGPDQRRIELGRQKPRHGERARVPCDMRLQRIFLEAERVRSPQGCGWRRDRRRLRSVRHHPDSQPRPARKPRRSSPPPSARPSGRASYKMARRDILDCCVRTSRTAEDASSSSGEGRADAWPQPVTIRKRAPRTAPLDRCTWGSPACLERGLDGTHCPRVAVLPTATLGEALFIVIVGIVVADVSRPALQEAKGQAGVPIHVVVGIFLVRLEADGAADAGREEIPQLVGPGVRQRSPRSH